MHQLLKSIRVLDLTQPFLLKIIPQEESLTQPAPRLGEHTAEVLTALGYGQTELEELKGRGVI